MSLAGLLWLHGFSSGTACTVFSVYTPNIAPAAAPPARTGASDLNPNASAFLDSVHCQGDDGSLKCAIFPPHLRTRPPGRPSCRCTRVWIHRRRRAALSPSATAGLWPAECVVRSTSSSYSNGRFDAVPRRWDLELRREPSTGDASAPPGPRRWDESGLGAPTGRPSFGHQGGNSSGGGGRSDRWKRYVP